MNTAMKLTLFDLDGTLLPVDSDHSFGEFLIQEGWVDAAAFKRRNDGFYADYVAERLDMHAYVDFATSGWRERPSADYEAVRRRFMRDVIVPNLRPAALRLVATHRDRGDLVALVTATNEFVTRPIAQAFGIEHLVATALQRDGAGNFTGRIDGTPCYREGKIARVSHWLAGEGLDWHGFDEITVYSDSTNDLPLLERATQAVATNPSKTLEATARARGWRILHLFA